MIVAVRGVYLGLIAACAACSFHAPADVDAVVDNPPVVTFEFAMSITDEGAQTANVRLHMNRAAVDPVTVDYAITGGTATPDIDYTLVDGSVTFAPGETTALIPVGIVQDVAEEDDETIDLAIVAVHGGDVGAQSTHVLTISKNLLPRVAFAAPTSSANEPDGAQAFGLALTVASPVDIVVSYTVGGSASAADHSLASDSTVTIPAGQTSVDLSDAITNDQIDENDETVDLTIVNATNAVIGAVAEHVHTILDEDPPPTIGFTVASQTVAEGVGTVNVVVQLSLESGKQISVDLGSSGNAVAGADFMLSATALTFAPGETQKTVTLTVVDDALDEDDEVATLALSNLQNVSAGQTTRTLTITDNDAPPAIDFAQASTTVDEGVGSTAIEVDLSAPSGKDVTFSLQTSGAAVAGTDFTLPTQPITIPAGQMSMNVTVTITNDVNDEDDESAQLAFTGIGNATPGTQTTHSLTILDNDNPPQVRFDPSVLDQSANEGDMGTTSFTYKVVLSVASGKQVSVGITRTGTASTPGDFTFGVGDIPVVFAPGETTKDVHVLVKGDKSNEPDETVIMTLQTPSNGTNANNNQSRTHTIKDDD